MRYSKGDCTYGELSPSVYGRPELPIYAAGMKVMKNCLPLPAGGWQNRGGTRPLGYVKTGGTDWRLKRFVFSNGDTYLLEFGNRYIRIYKNDVCVVSAPDTPYEITTPWPSAAISNLKITQSADTLFVTHPDYQTRVISRTADATWTIATYDYINGPFMLENDGSGTITPDAITGSNITLTATNAIFSNITGKKHSAGRALFKISHWIPAQADIVTVASPSTGTSTGIMCGGTWRIETHGTWTGSFKIEVSEDNSTWTASRIYSGNSDKNYSAYVTETFAKQFHVRVNVSAMSAGTVIVDLTSDPFEWVGVARITAVPAVEPEGGGLSQMYNTAKATILNTLGGTGATKIWAEGSWSDYRGYPACLAFHQDRLCFAGSYSEPDTVWMTKTGNYYDYGTSFPLQDDDGISERMPSRELNMIHNLIPLNTLLATSSSGIFTIGPQDGSALTPTNCPIKANDLAGASTINPAIINDRMVYAQTFNRIIRDTGYNYQTDGFQGINLNLYADQIFRDAYAVEMDYQGEPYQTLWVVRSDGKLCSLTYIKQAEIYGWAVHSTNRGFPLQTLTADENLEAGKFLSVCVLPGTVQDDVYVIVERYGTVHGTVERTIEKFINRNASIDPRKQVFMDCSYEYDVPKTITGITSASPAVVTSAAHGFSNGDTIDITGFSTGSDFAVMNGLRFYVTNKTDNTFELYTGPTQSIKNQYSTVGFGVHGVETGYNPIIDGVAYCRKTITQLSGCICMEGFVPSFLINGISYVVPATGGATDPEIRMVVDYIAGVFPAASLVQVGLPILYESEILPIVFMTTAGSTQGERIGVKNSSVRLLRSYGGKIGTDRNYMKEITNNDGTKLHHVLNVTTGLATGVPPALFSGEFDQGIAGGASKEETIIIRQDDPYPIEVLSLHANVTVGK
jgi:hypothetical protein